MKNPIEIAKTIVKAFEKGDRTTLDSLYQNIFRMIFLATSGSEEDALALKELATAFLKEKERLHLWLESERLFTLLYELGEYTATLTFAVELVDMFVFDKKFTELVNKEPKILTVMKAIKERNTVTNSILSQMLVDEIDFSSMLKIIAMLRKNELVTCHKLGNKNYYSLSLDGERLLANYIKNKN